MVAIKTLVPAALALLFGSGGIVAAEQGISPDASQGGAAAAMVPEFKQLDADRNGVISMSEAGREPTIVEQFGELDQNEDGAITEQEYAAVVRRGAEDEGT